MRLLLVDDHPILRHGARQHILARWPQAHVLEAGSLAQGEALLSRHPVDCLVLDLSLDDASGLDGLLRMRRVAPPLPILVLSGHSEDAFGAKSLRLGAAGYLNKKCAGDDLIQALETVLAGGRFITPNLAGRLAHLYTGGSGLLPHETLSPQELRVLLLIGAGAKAGRIADIMSLSAKTVSTYRARILEKMNLEGTADLIRYCVSHGLVKL